MPRRLGRVGASSRGAVDEQDPDRSKPGAGSMAKAAPGMAPSASRSRRLTMESRSEPALRRAASARSAVGASPGGVHEHGGGTAGDVHGRPPCRARARARAQTGVGEELVRKEHALHVLEAVIAGDDDRGALRETRLGERLAQSAEVRVDAEKRRLDLGTLAPAAVLEVIELDEVQEQEVGPILADHGGSGRGEERVPLDYVAEHVFPRHHAQPLEEAGGHRSPQISSASRRT